MYELYKNKQTSKKDNGHLKDYNVIESEEVKIISAIKTAKENEKNYINFIENTNIMQDEYIEVKKRNLNEIQNIEEELGENLKDCLRKYIIFKLSYLRNLQYDIDKKAKIMENINIRKDIYDYINKNSTVAIPPEKYEYLPYLCSVDIKNNLFLQKEIINEVKAFINNTFDLKNEKETISIKTKNFVGVESLANNAFINKPLTNEEKKDIIAYSSLKRSRRYLLEQLDIIRLKIGLNLTEITFNNLGDILKQCLIILENESDFESYKLIILLACSLYRTSEETNKPRIFLQNYILDFSMWKKFDFWKNLIKYEINEEMIKQKKYNMFNKENEKHKLKRIQLIVKSQLNTYLFNMISLCGDNNIMNDIILFYKNYYFLDKTIVDSLNNIIINYTHKKNIENNGIIEKKKDETISDRPIKNETVTTNDNEDNDEIEIIRNCTFKIEGNILDNLIQKQPCDNILKAKRRHKKEKEKEEKALNNQNSKKQKDNNINKNDENINNQNINNQELNNLNINLLNKDNNGDNSWEKDEIDSVKKNNYGEISESNKSKKSNDEYKEEDIESKIAITEFSGDKNDILDTFSIRENSNLNIINEIK